MSPSIMKDIFVPNPSNDLTFSPSDDYIRLYWRPTRRTAVAVIIAIVVGGIFVCVFAVALGHPMGW